MKSNKVYVLDYDIISPLGTGHREVFESLKNNFCAEGLITRFSTDELPVHRAAEIRADLSHFYSNEDERIKEAIAYDRKLELIVSVYYLMYSRLHSLFDKIAPGRAGVILGAGADVPNLEYFDKNIKQLIFQPSFKLEETVLHLNKGKSRLNTVFNPFDVNAIFLAERLKLAAFQKTILTACSASTQAIALGFESVINGETDMVLAGGADSILNSFAFMSFEKLGVLAKDEDGTGRSCRPFDINRHGTLAGEAAGLCVLASEKTVNALGLEPKIEITGYGNTLDAYRLTSPDPAGKGMRRALQNALDYAKILPGDVDYINLHGTGTRNNDSAEMDSLKSVFGESLPGIPVSSTKDRHGHAIAAAGIQEFIILCLCMGNKFVPCNLNLEKPIETEGADLVQFHNREKYIKTGITVNFAFGGVNTVLVTSEAGAN